MISGRLSPLRLFLEFFINNLDLLSLIHAEVSWEICLRNKKIELEDWPLLLFFFNSLRLSFLFLFLFYFCPVQSRRKSQNFILFSHQILNKDSTHLGSIILTPLLDTFVNFVIFPSFSKVRKFSKSWTEELKSIFKGRSFKK